MGQLRESVKELLQSYEKEQQYLASEIDLHKDKLSKVHQIDHGPVARVINNYEIRIIAVQQFIANLEAVLL